jgi:(E)-4-hydroxy-3-methylbut-2-enyl-diphosphate synthase
MTLIAKDSGAAQRAAAASAEGGASRPDQEANAGQVARLAVALALITAIFVVAGLGDVLLFIAIVIVIVMLHELGHFATAKWSGMKVTEYFVGFGPRLWSVRRGETEYGVKAIPAGGYVRITGFTVLEDVATEDEPRASRQQPFWKRIIVGSAGSAMHFIIAFVLALISVFAFGVATDNVHIDALEHWSGVAQTPAQLAGLRAGDTIVSVNGHPLSNVNTVHDIITRSVGHPVTLGVERGGHLRSVVVTPRDGRGVRTSGGLELAPQSDKKPQGFIGINEGNATVSVNPLRAIGDAGTAGAGHLRGILGPGPRVLPERHQFALPPGHQFPRCLRGCATPGHLGATGLADRCREHRRAGIAPGGPVVAGAPHRHQHRVRPAEHVAAHALRRRSCRGGGLRVDTDQEGAALLPGGHHQAVPLPRPLPGVPRGVRHLGHLPRHRPSPPQRLPLIGTMDLSPSLLSPRRPTRRITLGGVPIGDGAPISVQSMTTTKTADVDGTLAQIYALAAAGADIVRCTCNEEAAAVGLAQIVPRSPVPIVADIHFHHEMALAALEAGVQGLRLNPGNLRKETEIKQVAAEARDRGVPIRIGVNAGSLHPALYEKYGGATPEALVESARNELAYFEEVGFSDVKISVKASSVALMIAAYRLASETFDHPLHLGVTEAGPPPAGLVKGTAGIATLLAEGIGDTIRFSLTADPVEEARAGRQLLESLGLRERKGLDLIACPSCGRAQVDVIAVAKEAQEALEKLNLPIQVAVMGCVVNGPGEAREADIGIAAGKKKGHLFIRGKIIRVVPEDGMVQALVEEAERLVAEGVEARIAAADAGAEAEAEADRQELLESTGVDPNHTSAKIETIHRRTTEA